MGPGGNPFLALSDLDQPAGILVAYFSGTSAAADVKANAPTAQYQVLINQSTRGPIIEVDVTDKTSAGALGALNYITNQIPVELQNLQKAVSAPADAVITSMPLTVDIKAKADYSGTIRIVISAVVVGLLVTGIIAFALDGLLMGRRARRLARAEARDRVAATPVDPEEPSPTAAPHPHALPNEAGVTSSTAEESGDDLLDDADPQLTGPGAAAARRET